MIINLNEGIYKSDTDDFMFDFDNDTPDDILNIASVQIQQSNIGSNVYWFGYQFNPDINSKTRTNFIAWIKGLYTDKNKRPASAELYRFIDRPIGQLDKIVPFVTFDSIIYPVSNRSDLVKSIIRVVHNYIDRDAAKLNFELVKSLPKNINFDYKALEMNFAGDKNRINQMSSYAKDILMPSIHELPYFSIAANVKNFKYKPYIRDFLEFETAEAQSTFEALSKPRTLIIDDINTSGSTLTEMVRIIKKVNPTAEVYIFTLLGKELDI